MTDKTYSFKTLLMAIRETIFPPGQPLEQRDNGGGKWSLLVYIISFSLCSYQSFRQKSPAMPGIFCVQYSFYRFMLIRVSSISSETVMIMPKANQENAAINSAIVIIFGSNNSSDKKSLSPVTRTSTPSKIAVARIGSSSISRITGTPSSLPPFCV